MGKQNFSEKFEIEPIDEFNRHGSLFPEPLKGELCIEKT